MILRCVLVGQFSDNAFTRLSSFKIVELNHRMGKVSRNEFPYLCTHACHAIPGVEHYEKL